MTRILLLPVLCAILLIFGDSMGGRHHSRNAFVVLTASVVAFVCMAKIVYHIRK